MLPREAMGMVIGQVLGTCWSVFVGGRLQGVSENVSEHGPQHKRATFRHGTCSLQHMFQPHDRERERAREAGGRERREGGTEGGRAGGTKLLGADARSITLSENAVTTRIYLTIVLLTRAPGSELRATQSHGGFQAEVGKLRHA